MKGDAVQVVAEAAEGMDIAVAGASPVHKFDAELEGAARRAEEIILVDIEHAVEVQDRRRSRHRHRNPNARHRLADRGRAGWYRSRPASGRVRPRAAARQP